MSNHWREIGCPTCPAEAQEPCYEVGGQDDLKHRDPCPARLEASKTLTFYGVVGKDGALIVVDNKPYCLTTYKPAAECAITFVMRDGRNGCRVRAQGPLALKKFKIVEA